MLFFEVQSAVICMPWILIYPVGTCCEVNANANEVRAEVHPDHFKNSSHDLPWASQDHILSRKYIKYCLLCVKLYWEYLSKLGT